MTPPHDARPEGAPSPVFVRFVVVPFLPTQQPALGVSSLLAVLRRQGHRGDVRYLNLSYGQQLGWDRYKSLTGQIPTTALPGEMVFSRALWGERAPSFEAYRDRFARFIQETTPATAMRASLDWWTGRAEEMRLLAEDAPRVVAAWADALLADAPRVLGFTSTFQQNVPALALAQEVRRRVPREEVAIVFGGANCEDDMGRALADNFAFVDCVVSGEAEGVIVDVAERLAANDATLPRFVQGPMVTDMDALPLPDFADYYTLAREVGYPGDLSLVAESSRGCWWGAKSHCTFCGLNGGTMGFRSKSAERFAAELAELSGRHGLVRYALTDNILDMNYLRTLLPHLVAQARRYELFYETKSNLRKDQIEVLAAAGVYLLQPGIESLSSPILRLMGKGTTRLQNVQLLKWCQELGVRVTWNLLYGFPGEEPAEYAQMAELLPALYHLTPPTGATKVRLDRFGPYWKDPQRHGLANVRYWWSYDHTFIGLPPSERGRLAYFFEYEYADGRRPLDYAGAVAGRIGDWQRASRAKARLELEATPDGARVIDTRPGATSETWELTPAGLALVRALDAFRGRSGVAQAVRAQGVDVGDAECERLLEEFAARRLVIEENECVLCVIVDPAQRERVNERRVALRAGRLGFRWPEDFPDPAKREVVRAAMLALRPEPVPVSSS